MWGSLQDIIEQQYALAKKCNMGIIETNMLPDFERQIYVNLLLRDLEEERKSLGNN